jgi:hypothetical protein
MEGIGWVVEGGHLDFMKFINDDAFGYNFCLRPPPPTPIAKKKILGISRSYPIPFSHS